MPGNSVLKRDKTHIELLRIIAMFLVLFNHTWIRGFSYFNSIIDQPGYWFSLFFSILVKIDVPIFFMISGALLLPKEESLNKVFDRFGKTLLALFIFSFISFIYALPGHSIEYFSFVDFIKGFYQGSISGQYWYLYRYLGFLLLLPILRPMVKNISNRTIMYVAAVYLAVQCITILQYAISEGTIKYNGSFDLFILQDLIIFPILGYFLENRLDKNAFDSRTLVKMTALSVIAIIVSCIMTRYHCTLIGEWEEGTCQVFFNTLIVIPTFTAYLAAKMLFMKHDFSDTVKRSLAAIGSTIFGVYLLEQIYRDMSFDLYSALSPYIGTLPASLVWVLFALIMGCAITGKLRKIPYLNRII